MKRMPLRYNITSWDQLPQCLSNNSRNLKIDVSHFFNNDLLCGLRISVVHRAYGVLFSCMLGASGDLITSSNYYDDVEEPRAFELTPKQILDELYKFGFCIYYEQREHLSPGQIDYLITLKGLHYDKIRVLGVKGVKNGTDVFSTKVVAFNSENHSQWLDNTYRASVICDCKLISELNEMNERIVFVSLLKFIQFFSTHVPSTLMPPYREALLNRQFEESLSKHHRRNSVTEAG